MKKRILSLALALIMVITMIPSTAFAQSVAANPQSATPSTAIFADTKYDVEEFDSIRIYYKSGYTYKDVENCKIADTTIASSSFTVYSSYIEVTGKKRGQTTLTVNLKNGTSEVYKINVTAAPFIVTDSPYDNKVDRGDYDYIEVTKGFKEYNWTVEDESIIRLEDSFLSYPHEKKIVGLKKGETMISVTNEYGDFTSYKIKVLAREFYVEDKDGYNDVYVYAGESESIILSNGYDWEDCRVTVDDPSVASVDKPKNSIYDAYVIGKKHGATKIRVTNQYDETYTMDIYVRDKDEEISLDKEEYIVYLGQTVKIKAKAYPIYDNTKFSYAVWKGDPSTISISKDGVITPLKTGKVYVWAKCTCGNWLDAIVYVKAPYFSKSSYSIYKKQTLQLKLTGGRSDTKWTSSNTAVATVSSSGKVTAKKAGTVTITANTGGYKVKTTVKVSNPKLSYKSASIWAGKTLQLKVTGGVGTVKWKSSNTKVATVSSKGKVTAKKAGSATISATVSGVTLKCKVTVKGPQLSATKKSLIAKQTYSLKVNGATSKVKWSSTNSKVASVSSSGKVTAKKAGTAYIKAKVNGKTLKCKVTVKKNQKSYYVDRDVNQYDYGEPTVALKKAYFDGSKLKVDLVVINNRMFKASKFDWIIYKLYDNNGKLIASQKFKNVKLNISPYSSKTITLTFRSSNVKKKSAILNYGVSDYWSYYYTYVY